MISGRKALIFKKPANSLLKRKREKYVLSYYIRRTSLAFPINRVLLIIIPLSLLLMFPGQTFSKMYGLVTDQGNGITPGNVVVVNLEDKIVVNTIPVGINPEGIDVDEINGLAYVANRGSGSVSVIKIDIPNSSALDPPIPILGSPHYLDITPDGRYVLVTKSGMLNHGIDVIDISNRTVVQTIVPTNISFAPEDIDIDNIHAYVSYPDDFTVLLLDIGDIYKPFVDWSVSTSPDRPGRLIPILTPDYVYVTTDNNVIQIDPVQLEASYPFPASCFNNPVHLEFNPTWNDLYVSNKGSNSVAVINIDNPSICSSIDVGISPYTIDLDPGTYAYVANTGDGTISVIDVSTSPGSLIDTISDPKLITPIEIDIINGPPNSPPYIPKAPNPPDGQTTVPISTQLSWEGGDPDNDTVTYDVFMGTDPDIGLGQICAAIGHPDTFCTPSIPLDYGTTYYWMVVATDSFANTSEVPYPYWSFTTEGSAPSCEVTITPSTATVSFGEAVQFSASTTCNEGIVSGNYIWDLTSSLGSTIDENGLYTAGAVEGTDIVTVTDLANEGILDSAMVTVVSSEPQCEVTISPPSATVSSGEIIAFVATTNPIPPGTECAVSSYLWEVDSPLGSSITQDGVYNAGINNTGAEVTDLIIVIDMTNGNISNSAEVIVLAQGDYYVVTSPEEITLTSKSTCQFTAQTLDAQTLTPIPEEECSYQWEIFPPSTIGSTIDVNGLYKAGLNKKEKLINETVRAQDTAHNDASSTAIVTILVRYTSYPYLVLPPGVSQMSYRMISSGPLWPVDGDVLRIVTGGDKYNTYLARLFWWDGELNEGQGEYSEYPDIPELMPGIGIWAITLSGGIVKVDGTPIDTSQAFPITLPPRWSQIGHPFPKAVDWTQVSIIGGENEVEIPWTYTGIYSPSAFLKPWHGYFIYNNSSGSVTISIPPQQSEGKTTQTYTLLSEIEEGWQLQIGAQNIPSFWLKDTYNYIGISDESNSERDTKDLHEPPPISPNQISLSFPHEWDGKSERYTTDFRSLDSEKEIFEFTVNPGKGVISLLRLFWSDMEKVPQEYQMELIDSEKGTKLNMREVSEHWFFSYLGTDKHFKISMTKISH
jgi:YVTN family beta-propeller protein